MSVELKPRSRTSCVSGRIPPTRSRSQSLVTCSSRRRTLTMMVRRSVGWGAVVVRNASFSVRFIRCTCKHEISFPARVGGELNVGIEPYKRLEFGGQGHGQGACSLIHVGDHGSLRTGGEATTQRFQDSLLGAPEAEHPFVGGGLA